MLLRDGSCRESSTVRTVEKNGLLVPKKVVCPWHSRALTITQMDRPFSACERTTTPLVGVFFDLQQLGVTFGLKQQHLVRHIAAVRQPHTWWRHG